MDDAPLDGDVLELACGTGRWTERLARRARTLTAVDAAPEMLAIARQRAPATVALVEADLFAWRPERSYDAVVFCFWLTHVPPSRLAAFWTLVGDCLRRRPAGEDVRLGGRRGGGADRIGLARPRAARGRPLHLRPGGASVSLSHPRTSSISAGATPWPRPG
jgi:demethylmenaquinone methyltransferase/2-methoxy-6-polyprenyl-1,4-benzoquinol methylase